MDRLQYFFTDFDSGYSATKDIIMRIVTSLSASMHQHGEAVVAAKQKPDKLYFIRENAVTVLSSSRNYRLVDLSVGSWFGDYQVLFNQIGSFDYVAVVEPGGPPEVFLMTLPEETLLSICVESPDFDRFVRLRAMRKRAFLRLLEI